MSVFLKRKQPITLLHGNTYCPRSVLSKSVDPGTNFPAARLISLNTQKTKKIYIRNWAVTMKWNALSTMATFDCHCNHFCQTV